MSAIENISGTGPRGWTCFQCKTFLLEGCTHNCPTTAIGPWQPYTPQPPSTAATVDHGFAYVAALERIAAAIEKLAEAVAAAVVVSRTPGDEQ
jgi:coenzyme F420-reducing hydrogenase gamma subunit